MAYCIPEPHNYRQVDKRDDVDNDVSTHGFWVGDWANQYNRHNTKTIYIDQGSGHFLFLWLMSDLLCGGTMFQYDRCRLPSHNFHVARKYYILCHSVDGNRMLYWQLRWYWHLNCMLAYNLVDLRDHHLRHKQTQPRILRHFHHRVQFSCGWTEPQQS